MTSYATGRTSAFNFRATLQLNYCGGVPVSSAPQDCQLSCSVIADVGFQGSGWFHPVYRQCQGNPGITGFSTDRKTELTVEVRWGGSCKLSSYLDMSDFIPHWVTRVELFSSYGDYVLCSEVIDATVGTLSVTFQASVDCEEWATEGLQDNAHNILDGDRPQWAGSNTLSLVWKPVSDLALSASGGSIHVPAASQDTFFDRNAHESLVFFDLGAMYFPGTYEPLATLPSVSGQGDAPSPSAILASVSGLVASPYQSWMEWTGSAVGTGDVIPVATIGSKTFAANLNKNSVAGRSFAGSPRLDLVVNGTAHVWGTPVYDVPVAFYESSAPGAAISASGLFTSNRLMEAFPNVALALVPTEYGVDETEIPLFSYGETWNGLTVDRVNTLPVEDFARMGDHITPPAMVGDPYVTVPGDANGWKATLDIEEGPTYGNGHLTVTGKTSGTPVIRKELKNDFYEIFMTGAAAWWLANGGSASAAVQAYWNSTGDPATRGNANHEGDWWRIGKRLLSGSDVFNWSAFRYADLTAWADAPCTITLRVQWKQYSDPDDAETVTQLFIEEHTFEIELTAAEAVYRLDLARPPSVTTPLVGAPDEGHNLLRSVETLIVDFPAGATIHLKDITLKAVTAPTLDVHQSYESDVIGALSDGKQSLALREKDDGSWGWPKTRRIWRDLGGGYYVTEKRSMTMAELAEEINLQEGWTATAGGSPAHGSGNWAVWLKDAYRQALPATLTARRQFGSVILPPGYPGTLDMDVNLGYAVEALAFDPATQEASVAGMEIVTTTPTPAKVWAVKQSAANGAAELVSSVERGILVYASRGTAQEHVAGPYATRRKWAPVTVYGRDSETPSGATVLDIDRNGNKWAVFVNADNQVTLARKLGMSDEAGAVPLAAWEYAAIVAANDPWIHVEETHANARIWILFNWGATDHLSAAYNDRNGMDGWSHLRGVGTGRKPFIRLDKEPGVAFYSYWRGDAFYLKRSSDGAQTFLSPEEITVKAGVAEGHFIFDWRGDAGHTMEGVYSESGTVYRMSSADNGRTWGAAEAWFAGSSPFLRYDRATGILYVSYWHDAKHWMRRSEDFGATWKEAEIEMKASAEESVLTFDFQRNAQHRMMAVYTESDALMQITSDDNGLTWA